MKKGNYNCFVIYLSKREVRGKTKYQLKNWEVYHGVSKELACFYAKKNGYKILGFNQPFTKKADVLKAKFVFSYDPYENVVCIVQKDRLKQGRGWNAQYPLHPHLGISLENFSRQMERIIDCFKDYDKEQKRDYSIEASYIWGPRNLIPSGYEHITSGKVQEGDLYWESSSYGRIMNDYWCNCEISFSAHKPGSEIKLSGIVFKHSDGSEDIVNFYEPFVVRKKQ